MKSSIEKSCGCVFIEILGTHSFWGENDYFRALTVHGGKT